MPDAQYVEAFDKYQGGIFSVYSDIDDYLDYDPWDYRATSPLLPSSLSLNQAFVVAGELLQLLTSYYKLYDNRFNLSAYPQLTAMELIKGGTINSANMKTLNIENFILNDAWIDNDLDAIITKDGVLSEFGFNALLYLCNKSINDYRNDEKYFPDVYILLKLIYFENDWSNLYKIHESLKTFAEAYDYPRQDELKMDEQKLTKPANNFSIVGLLSRHGYLKNKKNINSEDCFSLSEAKEYVFSHVKKYLQWRCDMVKTLDVF